MLIIILTILWAGYTRNLVASSQIMDIKQSFFEMTAIRRSYGVADIRSYFYVYPFLSPDFSLVSQSDEDFVHSTYISWSAFVLCLMGWYKESQNHISVGGHKNLLYIGLLFFLLSLGPVLIMDMEPIVIFETYVLPGPYLIIEKFWGSCPFSKICILAADAIFSFTIL